MHQGWLGGCLSQNQKKTHASHVAVRLGARLVDRDLGFRLMSAGVVGDAHGFECTIQTALLTREHKDVKWEIVGMGAGSNLQEKGKMISKMYSVKNIFIANMFFVKNVISLRKQG